MNAYEQLIQRLDDFIRKYYKNRMVQGLLYVAALFLGLYLILVTLEFFGHFGPTVRTFFFFGFLASAAYFFVSRIALPFFSMLKLGKHISYEQAASIIGKHFPEVDDRLLNTLQLQSQLNEHAESSLLQASIAQRMQSLRPVPFTAAIDVKKNKKYLRYLLPLVAVFGVLFLITPSFILKPTDRLLRYNEIIEEEAPFSMDMLNDTLTAIENTDYEVRMQVTGKEIPAQVFIEVNGQKFQMVKKSNIDFSYTLSNVKEDAVIVFYGGKFHSKGYNLDVLQMPKLTLFQIEVNYPSYLKKENTVVNNTGDLLVPEGTQLVWKIAGENTSSVLFETTAGKSPFEETGDGFEHSENASQNFAYSVIPQNDQVQNGNALSYQVNVVADGYPSISVQDETDSTSRYIHYFTGGIQDDYGLTKLTFTAVQMRDGKAVESATVLPIQFEVGTTGDQFFHSVDFSIFNLEPGDEVNYFFEVWDNDGVHGAKSTRSQVRQFTNPTEEELKEMRNEQSESIKDQLESSLREAEKLQKEMKQLEREMLEKQNLNWQDKKKLEDLIERQKKLEEQVKEIQKQNQQRNQEQKDEQLAEKQKELERLMNEMLSPEMREMMEELQKLMNELNKDELRKEIEKMNLSTEDLEKELDRALEQFKELEVEEKLKEAAEKLNELADKQEKLANDESKSAEEKLKEQEQLNKEFEDVKKELKEAEELNKELETPQEIPDTEGLKKEIDDEQEKSSSELKQNKKANASKSQKKAAEKMKQMASEMQDGMEAAEQEQHEEDMAAMRALLENILSVSFDQEALMEETKKTQANDPRMKTLAQRQRKLKDDSRMIEDSLFALSKRVPEISSTVNHEINEINAHLDRVMKDFPDGNMPRITQNQQSAMTGYNNLALLLDDALQQMQAQMQSESKSKKEGKGSCNKPGGKGKGKGKSKASAAQMKRMQEGLQKQLEEAKKKGQNQGKNNSGGSKSGGDEGMAKELAQMAAKQAAIRKMMEEKGNELNEDGSGAGNELKQIAKEMEKLQRDIVNNQVTEESIRRQNDIMIRLLKAEEAERVREMDEERKSNEALNAPIGNPKKYEEFLKNKQKGVETLRSVSPNLKPYYKEKAIRYFRNS